VDFNPCFRSLKDDFILDATEVLPAVIKVLLHVLSSSQLINSNSLAIQNMDIQKRETLVLGTNSNLQLANAKLPSPLYPLIVVHFSVSSVQHILDHLLDILMTLSNDHQQPARFACTTIHIHRLARMETTKAHIAYVSKRNSSSFPHKLLL
jgi:hypothetical protein